eukprot:CAMPEP_0198317762 /NCGR_PEP_ID=MMETSP1450-20131203/7197_1 /TAXON_ID=753684 ORGANISM="Madagascaria erythrocladiodes, Strain CCMP3234" /NCGR_SAMPLE_ID=MMETSP1450 /ASSEMBLY_ACC=CAM_ASM_001115 /LENGTH=72 /DNA_ID=CAMNT_0044021007 /DNA_START=23 /DNA_END=238 /DNA_ORIENTATION=+
MVRKRYEQPEQHREREHVQRLDERVEAAAAALPRYLEWHRFRRQERALADFAADPTGDAPSALPRTAPPTPP